MVPGNGWPKGQETRKYNWAERTGLTKLCAEGYCRMRISTHVSIVFLLLAAEGALHNRANGFARGISEMQNTVNLFRDRQADAMLACKG